MEESREGAGCFSRKAAYVASLGSANVSSEHDNLTAPLKPPSNFAETLAAR